MTRYTNNPEGQARAINRLQEDAVVAESVIEDLSKALEDSERVCDRYREALVHIEQVVHILSSSEAIRGKVHHIVRDAVWTKVEDR